MSALNFPESPIAGQQYTANNTTFVYNGVKWVKVDSAKRVIAFDSASTLRTETPQDNDQVHILGVGTFIFKSGSTEIDDGETCFATTTGRWLLENVHFDIVEDQISESVDTFKTTVTQTLTGKQDVLVSGTNIRTINGMRLLPDLSIDDASDPQNITLVDSLHSDLQSITINGFFPTFYPYASATGNGNIVVVCSSNYSTRTNSKLLVNTEPYSKEFYEVTLPVTISGEADIQYLNGVFLIFSKSDNCRYVSKNGRDWTFNYFTEDLATTSKLGTTPNHFVIYDNTAGDRRLHYSKNGMDWSMIPFPSGPVENPKDVYGNSNIIVISSASNVYVSTINLDNNTGTTTSIHTISNLSLYRYGYSIFGTFAISTNTSNPIFIFDDINRGYTSMNVSIDVSADSLSSVIRQFAISERNIFFLDDLATVHCIHKDQAFNLGSGVSEKIDINNGYSSAPQGTICVSEDTIFFATANGPTTARVSFSGRKTKTFDGTTSGIIPLANHRPGRLLSGNGEWVDVRSAGKNLLDNGDFLVDQSNLLTTGMSAIENTDKLLLDRWSLYSSGIPVTINAAISSSVPQEPYIEVSNSSFINSLEITCSGSMTVEANDFVVLKQRVNYARHYGKSNKDLVLSFWFYQDAFQTSISASLVINNTSYVRKANISPVTGWQFVEIYFPQPKYPTGGYLADIDVNICLVAGSNRISPSSTGYVGTVEYTSVNTTNFFNGARTFRFTGIQLEQGKSFTGFEHKPEYESKIECQRWMPGVRPNSANKVLGHGIATSTTQARITIPCIIPAMNDNNTEVSTLRTNGTFSLTDGVNTYTCTAISLTNDSFFENIVVNCTIGTTDLVQFRNYFLISDSSASRLHVIREPL